MLPYTTQGNVKQIVKKMSDDGEIGGGSSSIEVNPEVTEESPKLNSIKVDDVAYEIQDPMFAKKVLKYQHKLIVNNLHGEDYSDCYFDLEGNPIESIPSNYQYIYASYRGYWYVALYYGLTTSGDGPASMSLSGYGLEDHEISITEDTELGSLPSSLYKAAYLKVDHIHSNEFYFTFADEEEGGSEEIIFSSNYERDIETLSESKQDALKINTLTNEPLYSAIGFNNRGTIIQSTPLIKELDFGEENPTFKDIHDILNTYSLSPVIIKGKYPSQYGKQPFTVAGNFSYGNYGVEQDFYSFKLIDLATFKVYIMNQTFNLNDVPLWDKLSSLPCVYSNENDVFIEKIYSSLTIESFLASCGKNSISDFTDNKVYHLPASVHDKVEFQGAYGGIIEIRSILNNETNKYEMHISVLKINSSLTGIEYNTYVYDENATTLADGVETKREIAFTIPNA